MRSKPKPIQRIQINIVDEEDSSRTRQIYESTKKGKLLRSAKLEYQAQVLDQKDLFGEKSSESCDSDYDDNEARERRIRQNAIEHKQKKLAEQDKLHDRMLSNFRRDWQQIDTGTSGKTIEMDERFVDNEQFKKMRKRQEDHTNLTAEEVMDITHGSKAANAFLVPVREQIEDLVGMPEEHIMLPAKARMTENERSRAASVLRSTAPGGFSQLVDEPEVKRKSPRPNHPAKDLRKVAKNNFFDGE